ncbi:CLUMA_CG011459, isoform A [Clunio marinus]|uniref:CLUMA_CG011459, isoform A n=1 Tax=Clunio marinus TaxID=568069 RepID=A0A1J1ID05_9DIPT|nr:CLUMA_CG011459, isoform A [Clunio marinus]
MHIQVKELNYFNVRAENYAEKLNISSCIQASKGRTRNGPNLLLIYKERTVQINDDIADNADYRQNEFSPSHPQHHNRPQMRLLV